MTLISLTKAESDAPNYRDAGPANLNVCETCRYSEGDRRCTRYDFNYRNGWTCDAWRPNVEATRKRHQELSQMTKSATFKREIPNRGDLSGSDFLYPDLRSFPIVKPADVKAAVNAWGRASKVRAAGHTFEDFKKRLTRKARSKGAEFVAMLPKDWMDSEKSFAVFKVAAGRYRWVMRSSSAFEDKDREIVSTKALDSAVAYGDQAQERGPLRFWHMPGVDIGECDFQMLHGRMLIESGTFKDSDIAERVAEKAHLFGGSIGFNHPQSEPDAGGVFHNIRIFERSLVPIGRASNRFTAMTTVRSDTMSKEKREALKALVGEEKADQILAEAFASQKAAEAQGFTYKSNDELAELNAAELIDYALAMKEFEDSYQPEPEEDETAEETPLTAKEFQAGMAEFAAVLASSLKEAITGQAAPAPDRKKEIDAAAQEIETTKKQVTALQAQLKEAQTQLAELTGEQTRAVKEGYRATQKAEPIDPDETKARKQKEMAAQGDPWGLTQIQDQLGGWPGQNGQ